MIRYRSDIDGLRALSIAPVLLFHAGYSFVSGGFVGVDTFFVISGYLITSMISREIAEGQFSFGRFYMRRARRLLPALICVYAAVLAFSWLYDTQYNFQSAVQQVFASIFYASNIYYLVHIDYFAGDSFDFILLHTWSLSIEEQFYLIFPAAIWLAYKISQGQARSLLVLATLASLAFSAYLSLSTSNGGEYYHSFSRFWELGIGGCAALFQVKITKGVTTIRLASVLVILAAPFLIQPHFPFPFPAAVPSVLATVLLIVTRDNGTDLVTRGLSWPVLVYVGKISYSLYIWHWVVFVAARKIGYFDGYTIPLVILLTVVISVLSYHVVEQPLRYSQPGLRSHKAMLSYFAAAMSLLIALPLGQAWTAEHSSPLDSTTSYEKIMAFDRVGFRESGELDLAYRGGDCFLEPNTTQTFAEDCYTLSYDRPNIALIGDSNAAHLSAGVRFSFPDAHVLQLSGSNCIVTAPGVLTRDMDGCREENRLFFENILPSDDIDLYIFSARWSRSVLRNGAFEQLLMSLDERGLSDKTIIVGRQVYFSQAVANQAVYNLRTMSPDDWEPEELNRALNDVISPAEELHTGEDVYAMDETIARLAHKHGIVYVSALELQRHPDGIEFVSPAGELLYWDTGHLTTAGGRHRVSQIISQQSVREVLGSADVGTVRH